jgi:hypothetical protein
MSAALQTGEFSHEALAFVNGVKPESLAEPAAVTVEPPTPLPPPPAVAGTEQRVNPAGLDKRSMLRREEPAGAPDAGLVSVTVRVPRFVLPGLLLASVDRKLKRQRPWTQQEIVAEALTQWLRKHGYLS